MIMVTLRDAQLDDLRQTIAKLVSSVTWTVGVINSALQATEDVLEGMAFDPEPLIDVRETVDAGSQIVQNGLDTGNITSSMAPIAERFVADNPALTSVRTFSSASIVGFVAANFALFSAAVAELPDAVQSSIVVEVVRLRMQAAL